MGRSKLRGSSPIYLNPSPKELSPSSPVFVDWDQETTMGTSRPTSLAIPRTGSPFTNPPSLEDILANVAPPPWTLSSFMAFLSQNHCLETLEFIMAADRYRTAYQQFAEGKPSNDCSQICSLWRKVIDAYIMPCAPREVNLPSHVRDRLLQHKCCKSNPPHPIELDEAVHIIQELINDSVLVSFIESVLPAVGARSEDFSYDSRHGRSRLDISPEGLSGDEGVQSPRASYIPFLNIGRNSSAGNRSTLTSVESVDFDLMTDFSSSPNSWSGTESMTPPVTPPTSSCTRSTSPTALQRAITGSSWKKMGAKLGLTKKSSKSIRRTTSTSSGQPPL